MSKRSTIRLSGLCKLVTEPVKPGSMQNAFYLGLEHLVSGKALRTGGGNSSKVRSTTYAFQSGDVLYGKLRPYLDKAVLADKAGICTTELLVLRAKPGVDPRFLVAVIHSPRFIEYTIAGTTGVQHPRTSWAHIREFEVPAFSSDEQRQIANLIWHVYDAISRVDAVIREGQSLKHAAMKILFTHGLRSETQKDTEIGPVPKSWELTPCHRIFKLVSGKKRPKMLSDHQDSNTPFPVLGGNGILGFANTWQLDTPHVLVIGRVGEYCGSVHIASGKICITDNALYAKEWYNDDAEIRFVGAFLDHFDLNRFKRIAGQPLITQSMINEHDIPLPDKSEQKEIVAILATIDHAIDLYRRKQSILEDLFKVLLCNIMTDKILIDDLDCPMLNERQNNIGDGK